MTPQAVHARGSRGDGLDSEAAVTALPYAERRSTTGTIGGMLPASTPPWTRRHFLHAKQLGMKWPLALNILICAAGCARSPSVSEGAAADAKKGQGNGATAPRDDAALDSEISLPDNDAPSENDRPSENDGPSGDDGLSGNDAGNDASEDVSSGEAGENEATPGDARDVQEVDAADAAADAAHDASDGAADGGTCANGNRSLSNIGTQDFHISFRVTTKQTGWMALVSQRSACYLGVFWDIRQCGVGAFCPADGELFVETEGDSNASYNSVHSAGRINDGNPHTVEVVRASGVLTIRIDGALSGMGTSAASFGTMPPLQVGNDACVAGNPATASFAAGTTLSDLCLTSP